MHVRSSAVFVIAIVLLSSVSISQTAKAVTLNPDGSGQALIFPYYTVQSSNGNAFNTFITVVNGTSQAKALRVRFREGRNSRQVAAFNLFLSGNDAWAAAIVPTPTGARVITLDRSCVSPQLTANSGEPPGASLTNDSYLGDGNGDGLERTREGWVEMIEMATLTGSAATAVRHDLSTGIPSNCASVQGAAAVQTAPPTGGLSGTLTLLNVASGMDFTLMADALSDLASRAYYRAADDPYPDFNALEIDPVSVVNANGFVYRSTWGRGVDAVSASLMRSSWLGEHILDAQTLSKTDFVVTFPTRHHYVVGATAAAPFTASCQFVGDTFAGEPALIEIFTREEFGGVVNGFHPFPLAPNFRCGASTVVDFHNSAPHTAATASTLVLGSQNRGWPDAGMTNVGALMLNSPLPSQNGWVRFTITGGRTLTSLPTSTRMSMVTGDTIVGPHSYSGLPVVGFTARTFENGTLSCGAGTCQGNYGGSFPLRFGRTIAPPG